MIKKYFLHVISFIFMLLLSQNNYAWWSIEPLNGNSSHRNITNKALNDSTLNEYPDLVGYKDKIIEWSTLAENDQNAHGRKYENQYGVTAIDFNGGPYPWWWDRPETNDGVLVKYKKHRFINNLANDDYAAYYYLAMMCHLIEDQAVPAHVANIKHGYVVVPADLGDNFEVNASDESPLSTVVVVPVIKVDPDLSNLVKRYYYYENTNKTDITGLIPLTQSYLPFWKSPTKVGNPNYWLENSDTTNKYTGVMFYANWGKYGGLDFINEPKDIYDEGDDDQDIIQTQYAQAVNYICGFLQTVSKKLPPIVSGLTLTKKTIISNDSTPIKFTVDENRQPYIWLKMTVDGKAIKDISGIVYNGKGDAYSSLNTNSDSTGLPWAASYAIPWTGLLEDTTYPADGQYRLVVMVQDYDSNWSDSTYDSFFFFFNPPEVSNV